MFGVVDFAIHGGELSAGEEWPLFGNYFTAAGGRSWAGWSPSLPIMVRGTRVDPFPADGQRQLQGSQYGVVDSFDQESWQRARTGAVRA